jgi:hypothetical protein
MIINNSNKLIENIYYLMWLKDDSLKDSSFPIHIPDTILFRQEVILNWYFSSKKGEILMKKEYNLKHEIIYEKFT